MDRKTNVALVNATKENAPATQKATGAKKAQQNSTRRPRTADDAIRQAFRRGETLTDWEAGDRYGCKRFRTLMSELRHLGWLFHDEWVKGRNRYGNDSRWKEYRLIKAGA